MRADQAAFDRLALSDFGGIFREQADVAQITVSSDISMSFFTETFCLWLAEPLLLPLIFSIRASSGMSVKDHLKRIAMKFYWIEFGLFFHGTAIRAIAIASLIVIGVCLVSTQPMADDDETNGHVFDCSEGPDSCVEKSLEYVNICPNGDPATCLKIPVEHLNEVKKLSNAFDSTNYVTDPNNYIDGSFTDEKYKISVITKGLNEPWDMDFLPSGEIIVTEKGGGLLLIRDGRSTRIGKIDVWSQFEAGLMGVAVDPEFTKNNYVYLYYTIGTDPQYAGWEFKTPGHTRLLNKIVRYTLHNDQLFDEFTILDNIPGSGYHDGGRLAFGPDGKLYATTGDGIDEIASLDTSSLVGKILRLNKDGSIPDDNPFAGSPVYSKGHRNPQGLAWHPTTGELFASEHGPMRYDEINAIVPGGSYGWGIYKCDANNRDVKELPTEIIANLDLTAERLPVVCFDTWTMAPSGMDFFQKPDSPWYGDLFVAGLRGGHIRRIKLEDGKFKAAEIFFVSAKPNENGSSMIENISLRLRNVKYGNGALYVLGDAYGLIKIEPEAQ